MENHRTQDESALERYKIISPILSAMEERADTAKIGLMKSEACGQAGISRKTINRWLDCYAQNGFDGLKYRGTAAKSGYKIPGELVKEAVLLRMEVPSRSVPQIIEILEMEGKAPKGFLKRSTLQDRLRGEGYSKTQMKLYQSTGIAADVLCAASGTIYGKPTSSSVPILKQATSQFRHFSSGLLTTPRDT